MGKQKFVELDSRRRLALGTIGDPDHRYYYAQADPAGVITLTPAVVMPASEADALRQGGSSDD